MSGLSAEIVTGPFNREQCGRCALGDHCLVASSLSRPDPERMARIASHQRLPARKVVFVQGEAIEQMSVVTQGVIACSKALDDGRRQITGFMFPGDILGHFYEEHHSVTAQTVTEVSLCRFTREALIRLADENPKLEQSLFRRTVSELGDAQRHELLLGRQNARERVAAFVLMLAEHDPRSSEVPLTFRMPMTRFDIADYLGLTFETVSRTFGNLARDRLIELPTPQEIVVRNLKGLERIADGGERE